MYEKHISGKFFMKELKGMLCEAIADAVIVNTTKHTTLSKEAFDMICKKMSILSDSYKFDFEKFFFDEKELKTLKS